MFDSSGPKAKVELVIVGLLLPLAWLTVFARFIARGKLMKTIGWDDFFMLFTAMLFTGYCALMIMIIGRGGFRSTPLADTLPRTAVLILTSEVFYILSTVLLKISLALFFLRVLIKRWQRYSLYIALGISTFSGAAYVFLAIFQCGSPMRLVENIIAKKCIGHMLYLGFGYFYGAINIVADWTFVIVPIIMLREVVMERRAKLGVQLIMALGAVGSISGSIRMIYIEGAVFGENFFENAANLAIWSTVEPGIGIIAGSLATLRPLLRAAISRFRHTNSNNHDGRGHASSRHGGHVLFESGQLRMAPKRDTSDGFEPVGNASPPTITTRNRGRCTTREPRLKTSHGSNRPPSNPSRGRSRQPSNSSRPHPRTVPDTNRYIPQSSDQPAHALSTLNRSLPHSNYHTRALRTLAHPRPPPQDRIERHVFPSTTANLNKPLPPLIRHPSSNNLGWGRDSYQDTIINSSSRTSPELGPDETFFDEVGAIHKVAEANVTHEPLRSFGYDMEMGKVGGEAYRHEQEKRAYGAWF